MASASRSFTVLDTPGRTWAAAADVNRWRLALPEAARKGWGDRWSLEQYAVGAPVAMTLGGRVVQEWAIEELRPGQALKLASRVWHGVPQQSMSSTLEVGVTPVSE